MAKSPFKIHEEPSMRSPETGASFFTIEYKPSKTTELIAPKSHRIISCLKKTNDLILEIDSALLTVPKNERLEKAVALIKAMETFNLVAKSHKSRIPQGLSLFEKLLSNANDQEVLQALLYIPDAIWNLEDFKSRLPIDGARYYVLKDNVPGEHVMEQLFNGLMSSADMVAAFDLNIFDYGILGQMGIYAYGPDKDEIFRRLERCL